MASRNSEAEHYTYLGIGFQRTAKGHWLFDEPPSSCDSWSRYATDEEAAAFNDLTTDSEQGLATMHKMIDRYVVGQIIYSGDLRYR